MEEIKQKIAEENGFNNWDMMIRCYCKTKPGQRVLKKNTDKALNMYIVSQQRELLLAYEEYTSYKVLGKKTNRISKQMVEDFLANNCG